MTYTVMLLRPDYIADGPLDTYTTTVFGVFSAEHAVERARDEVMQADEWTLEDAAEPEDYAVVFVAKGVVDFVAVWRPIIFTGG